MEGTPFILKQLHRALKNTVPVFFRYNLESGGSSGQNCRFFIIREITHGGQADAVLRIHPTMLKFRLFNRFQADIPHIVNQLPRRAAVAAAQKDVKVQLRYGVPGHSVKFPNTFLPHIPVQV